MIDVGISVHFLTFKLDNYQAVAAHRFQSGSLKDGTLFSVIQPAIGHMDRPCLLPIPDYTFGSVSTRKHTAFFTPLTP